MTVDWCRASVGGHPAPIDPIDGPRWSRIRRTNGRSRPGPPTTGRRAVAARMCPVATRPVPFTRPPRESVTTHPRSSQGPRDPGRDQEAVDGVDPAHSHSVGKSPGADWPGGRAPGWRRSRVEGGRLRCLDSGPRVTGPRPDPAGSARATARRAGSPKNRIAASASPLGLDALDKWARRARTSTTKSARARPPRSRRPPSRGSAGLSWPSGSAGSSAVFRTAQNSLDGRSGRAELTGVPLRPQSPSAARTVSLALGPEVPGGSAIARLATRSCAPRRSCRIQAAEWSQRCGLDR